MSSVVHAQSWLPASVDPVWAGNKPTRVIRLDFDSSKSENDNGAILKAAIEKLVPGDGLAIGPGRWSIVRKLDITLQGTQAKPIWIYARDPANKPVITRPDANQNAVNMGESRPARYLVLQNLEITNGSYLLRMLTCDNIWIDRCYIHDGKGVGISTQRNCSRIHITRNTVTNPGPGTLGEGMYIGTNSGQYITTWSVIAYNHVYNTMSSRHGDGIELKQGCHHNWVIGNLVHDTPYPNILVYGTGSSNINVVERNVCYNSQNECLQVQGDAIVRNNVAVNGKGSAFLSNDHAKPTQNIQVTHNTFINTGDAVTLGHWSGKPKMVFANNVVYSKSGRSLRFGQRTTGPVVTGNFVYGRTENVPTYASNHAGGGIADFMGGSWDATKRDFRPVVGGTLDNRGLLTYATPFDIRGIARKLPVDPGAVESLASLVVDRTTLVASQGGSQNLVFYAGPRHANHVYVVLGSLTGQTPGLNVGNYTLPVVPDAWFNFTITNGNTGLLQRTIGRLNALGGGTATFALPKLPAAYRGAVFHHSVLVFDFGGARYVTNAGSLRLL